MVVIIFHCLYSGLLATNCFHVNNTCRPFAPLMCNSHQRTNNVMERYNRDFNKLFDTPKPGLFVFCERVREEAVRWEKRHDDALKGRFTNRQGRKDISWPEIPFDFDEFEPKKGSSEAGIIARCVENTDFCMLLTIVKMRIH